MALKVTMFYKFQLIYGQIKESLLELFAEAVTSFLLYLLISILSVRLSFRPHPTKVACDVLLIFQADLFLHLVTHFNATTHGSLQLRHTVGQVAFFSPKFFFFFTGLQSFIALVVVILKYSEFFRILKHFQNAIIFK